MNESLIELATRKFGTLTEPEQRLFRAVVDGKFPDFSSPNPAENDPATADSWPPTRAIPADRISWMATDADAARHVTHRGIGLKGVRIDGRLDLQAANIVFALYFDRCALAAGISMLGAEVHALNLSGSYVGRITADGLKVEGSVTLRAGCTLAGRVRLIGACIGGNLDCEGGIFLGTEGEALAIDSAKIAGSVLLNQRFRAAGQVRMLGAEIGGNLSCDAGEFNNPGKTALAADRLKVEGNVFLSDGFHAIGGVSLPSATINGIFVWRGIANPKDTSLDLRSARLGTLWISRESWPSRGKLHLQGLTYELLDDQQAFGSETWIEWLRLQPARPFRPQPYEQLAAVLRKDGLDADAKRVQYAKEVDRARNTKLSWSEIPWYRIFGPLIGYGFRPWRALWLSVAVVVFGAVLFGIGHSYDLMVPAKPEGFTATIEGKQSINANYPLLAPIMYSLDTFTPLIDLGQADFWLPAANRGATVVALGPLSVTVGGLLRVYLWFHIISGWVLSSLLFVGLTGSIPGA